jgi:outer membrane protein
MSGSSPLGGPRTAGAGKMGRLAVMIALVRRGPHVALVLLGIVCGRAGAQEVLPTLQVRAAMADVQRITLDEAKQRALANNKLLSLAAMNIRGKEFAVNAARADYFPKIVGTSVFFAFNEPLGTVITTRGHPLLGLPPMEFSAHVINEDSNVNAAYAAQPITALLLVRQGVRIAEADQQIAQAELDKGTRALLMGVEQLYWGLLATEHIRAGLLEAAKQSAPFAGIKLPEVQVALIEGQQGLQQVDAQIADLEEQMNNLLDNPPCTKLEMVEPPPPTLCVGCCDELISQAIANSPEVRSAEQDVVKANAAVKAAKVDYLPNVAVLGGVMNQSMADYIQPDAAFIGVMANYTFVDWGKRRNVLRERENLVSMACLKVEQTKDEVRQKAMKAYREFEEHRAALKTAQEVVEAHKAVVKKLTTPTVMQHPEPLLKASKDLMTAEVDLIKAEMAVRVSAAQVMSLTGR